MMGIGLDHIVSSFKDLQDEICLALEKMDGAGKFHEDAWQMAKGKGGGRTRVISGDHIEKGGVNFSHVTGTVTDKLRSILKRDGTIYHATGVSIVLHPVNPWVPIIHMNVRYFEMDDETWWFGGGIDVTPHYIDRQEAGEFHRRLKSTCDKTDPSYYLRFKQWADDYFYLPHRDETRGIGGIFFDRLDATEHPKGDLFDFVLAVGKTFIPCYEPLFRANYKRTYTDREVSWRNYRRGRYVEFNLVWDRGTKFGLETGGRTESILMSLPSMASWVYNFHPEEQSKEAITLQSLHKGIDWLNDTPIG